MFNQNMKAKSSELIVGDWVEVRTKAEILGTLDSNGQLDGMPFMPEMFAFCGKRFQVYKRAHKTCDTVFPVRGRRVADAVHLETRCDGSAHGGCQASCLIFWKDAWLKPISKDSPEQPANKVLDLDLSPAAIDAPTPQPQNRSSAPGAGPGCSESDVWALSRTADSNPADPTYNCQATQLPYATTQLDWWDIRQYIEDYTSGNVTLWRFVCSATYFLYFWISNLGIGLGRPMRWFYDRFHRLWRGTPIPRKTGTIPEGQPTPAQTLDLKPGELVRIKSHDEILATLNTRSKNRGLYWDAEEVPYCGETRRVLKRVTQIVNERTGKMQEMKTPCVILDDVICQSRYSECRVFCPRSIYSYWREIWLERVGSVDPEVRPEDAQVIAQ
jgi:hypothetical protein